MSFGKSYAVSVSPIFKYATDHSLRQEPIQKRLFEKTLPLPMGPMIAAPEVTQLLQNFIRSMNMKNVIEVGVFTGYSTLGFAMVMPDDGKIIACDIDAKCPEIGRQFWKEAGVEHKIDLRIKPAHETVDELLAEGLAGTFDLAFIDADKDRNEVYFEKCLQLLRRGGIIAIDNVLRCGAVLEDNPTARFAKEVKAFNDKIKDDKRIDISMLVLGDGLTLAFKR